jgi:hypothetical protein
MGPQDSTVGAPASAVGAVVIVKIMKSLTFGHGAIPLTNNVKFTVPASPTPG